MFRIAAALMGIVLSTMLALNLRFGMTKRTQFSWFSALLYLCLICYSLANLVAQLLGGNSGEFTRFILGIANFCDYLFTILLPYPIADVKALGFPTAWQQVRDQVKAIRFPAQCQSCRMRELCHICLAKCYTETLGFEQPPNTPAK